MRVQVIDLGTGLPSLSFHDSMLINRLVHIKTDIVKGVFGRLASIATFVAPDGSCANFVYHFTSIRLLAQFGGTLAHVSWQFPSHG